MAEPHEHFVNALFADELNPRQIRAVISHMRTLGYINEIQYSRLNTELSESTRVVRTDGAETIEMARLPKGQSDITRLVESHQESIDREEVRLRHADPTKVVQLPKYGSVTKEVMEEHKKRHGHGQGTCMECANVTIQVDPEKILPREY